MLPSKNPKLTLQVCQCVPMTAGSVPEAKTK